MVRDDPAKLASALQLMSLCYAHCGWQQDLPKGDPGPYYIATLLKDAADTLRHLLVAGNENPHAGERVRGGEKE